MQHLSMAPIMIVCGASLLLLQFVAPASCQRVDQLGPPDFCLAGPFHLERPHPEPQEFDECQSWEDQACCSAEVTRIINEERAVGLYNFTWDLCGTLSQECETFIKVCSCCRKPFLKVPACHEEICVLSSLEHSLVLEYHFWV